MIIKVTLVRRDQSPGVGVEDRRFGSHHPVRGLTLT